MFYKCSSIWSQIVYLHDGPINPSSQCFNYKSSKTAFRLLKCTLPVSNAQNPISYPHHSQSTPKTFHQAIGKTSQQHLQPCSTNTSNKAPSGTRSTPTSPPCTSASPKTKQRDHYSKPCTTSPKTHSTLILLLFTPFFRRKTNRKKKKSPPNPTPISKIRDFAYELHDDDDDPALSTAAFLAAFTDSGFRSRYQTVNTGDLLSQAGFPAFEKLPLPLPPGLPFQYAPHYPLLLIDKEPQRRPDHARAQAQVQAQEEEHPPAYSFSSSFSFSSSSSSLEEEETYSASSDTLTAAGVDDALTPIIAKKEKKKRKRKHNSDINDNQEYNRRNNRGFRDTGIITAVAACMMEYMH